MRPAILVCIALLAASVASGQFTEVTDAMNCLGISVNSPGSSYGGGTSFYDFNNDGWDDLTIFGTDENNQFQPIVFLENNGGNLVLADFEIPLTGTAFIHALLWVDYDNDGDADLFLTRKDGPVELWQNDGDFNFSLVTNEAGLLQGSYRHAGACFGDYNHNGCLDLYITRYYNSAEFSTPQYANLLYRNNCDGTFTDVTEEAGVYLSPRPTLQPVFADLNNDGWEDLFIAVDRVTHPNELFINNQDGTFTRVTSGSGIDTYMDAMSATVGDYNHNGLLDIYVTNSPIGNGNSFYENNGDGNFTDRAVELDIELMIHGWGAMWLDHDNDTWQDLIVSTMYEGAGLKGFINLQGEAFVDSTAWLGSSATNPDGSIFNSETFVLAMGDLNNDGYYDFVSNNHWPESARLYRNLGGENNFIAVTPEGTISNRDGIGTWIRCYVNGEELVRQPLCGENLNGQNPRKQNIGIGAANKVDSLVLDWNSGTREVYYNLDANQHLHLVEGATYTQSFDIVHSGDTALCPGDSLLLNAGEFESYLWSTGDTTQYLSVSEPGTYSVEAWNQFGLSATSFPVIIAAHPFTEISTATTHVSCAGAQDGSIELGFSTGLPNSLTWSNGASETILENLSGGLYNYTCTDQFGCPYAGEVFVNEPPPLLASIITSHVLCYGDSSGMVNTLALGGTPPYSTDWNGLNPDTLSAGNYNATLSDANGCESDLNFEITQPDSLWISIEITPAIDGEWNGTAEAQVYGGIPPYNIVWNTGVEDQFAISGLAPGEYSISVSDENGCLKSEVFSVQTNTGINTFTGTQPPLIFPVPVKNIMNIEQCGGNVIDVNILNTLGQQVFSEKRILCPASIPLPIFAKGFYMVEILTGNERYVIPIIVDSHH